MGAEQSAPQSTPNDDGVVSAPATAPTEVVLQESAAAARASTDAQLKATAPMPTGGPLKIDPSEGKHFRPPSEVSTITAGSEDSLSQLPPMSRSKGSPASSFSSGASTSSKRLRSLMSWRPAGAMGVGTRRARQHKDPKVVFEGLEGLSLHCALGQVDQVKRLLKLPNMSPDERDGASG